MRKYLMVIALLLMSFINPVSSSSYNITTITFSPELVHTGDLVTVTVTFSDTTGIDGVNSFYCKLEPTYLCHVPILSFTQDGNSFSGSFTVLETSDEIIGFDLIIKFDNDTEVTLPGEEQLDFGLELAEPITGIFYYKISISNGDSTTSNSSSPEEMTTTNETPFYFVLPVVLVIFKKIFLRKLNILN